MKEVRWVVVALVTVSFWASNGVAQHPPDLAGATPQQVLSVQELEALKSKPQAHLLPELLTAEELAVVDRLDGLLKEMVVASVQAGRQRFGAADYITPGHTRYGDVYLVHPDSDAPLVDITVVENADRAVADLRAIPDVVILGVASTEAYTLIGAAVPVDKLLDVAAVKDVRAVHPSGAVNGQGPVTIDPDEGKLQELRDRLSPDEFDRMVFPEAATEHEVDGERVPETDGEGGPAPRSQGAANNQAEQALDVDDARRVYSWADGGGVDIGTLSDSCNGRNGIPGDGFVGIDESQNTGDLPPDARILIVQDWAGQTDEGRGMMEHIYDIAPAVGRLGFATAYNSEANFANNITALRNNNMDIINDDVVYYGEPFYQDGVVAQAVVNYVNAGGIYFALNHNFANRSYESVWADAEPDNWHDFAPGDAVLRITIPGNGSVNIGLQWSQPWGGRTTNLDLELWDNPPGTKLADSNTNTANPYDSLGYTNPSASPLTANIAISRVSGSATGLTVKFIEYKGATFLEYTGDAAGTLTPHAGTGSSIAIGAAPYWTPGTAEDFSGRGPHRRFYTAGGAWSPAVYTKPDFLGIDGCNTTFFGSPDMDGDGWPNFFGTSAATPNVAAVATLMLEAAGGPGNLNQTDVRNIMRITAIELGDPGHDIVYGYGRVHALGAVCAARGPEGTEYTLYPNQFGEVSFDQNLFDSTDVDRIEFATDFGGAAVVDIVEGHASMDPMVLIMNQNSGDVVAADYNSGPGDDARVNYTASSWGLYTAKVLSETDFTGSADFTIDINLPDPSPAILSIGADHSGLVNGNIGSTGDLDYYRVTVPAGIPPDLTRMLVDNTPTGFNSMVHIYNASGGLVVVANNGGTGATDSTEVSGVAPGEEYVISVTSWSYAGSGDFTLNVQFAPGNDYCADATVIPSVPFFTDLYNGSATADGPPTGCNSGSATVMQNSVWYRYLAAEDCKLVLDVDPDVGGDAYDAVVGIYSGTSCASLTEIACGDEPDPIHVEFAASAGTTYWFQIGDWGISPGGGNTTFALECRPSNDDCMDSTIIPGIPYSTTFDNSTATGDGPPGSCNAAGTLPWMDNDVWFTYRTPEDCNLILDVDPTTYDGIVGVYEGANCASLIEIACGDQPQPIHIEIPAVAGSLYWFQVGDWGTADGGGLTTLDLTCRPLNDDCADAISIGVPSTTFGTTTEATLDSAPTCGVSNSAPGVWYRVWGTGRTMTATTCGDFYDYDTKISVYCADCATLPCVMGSDDSCVGGASALLSTVPWCSQSGAEYLILVHGYGSSTGDFQLDVFDDGLPCTGAVDCGGQPIGACCASPACTTGGVCPNFPACGGSFICGCFSTDVGDTECFSLYTSCGTACPNGVSDCGAGEVCIVDSCCPAGPVCGTPNCPGGGMRDAGEAEFAAHIGAETMGGELDPATWDRAGTGECIETTLDSCNYLGGTYQGDGVSCGSQPCCEAPLEPADPSPADGATDVPTYADLLWNGWFLARGANATPDGSNAAHIAVSWPRTPDGKYLTGSGELLDAPPAVSVSTAADLRGEVVQADVLVYTGNGSMNEGYAQLTAALNAAGKSVDVTPNWPVDLARYCAIYLAVNTEPFNAGQTQALVTYVNNGGVLVAMGDWDGWAGNANAVMNELAAALGSTMSLIPDSIDGGCGVTPNIGSHAFTAGVSSLTFGAASQLVVGSGTVLARTDPSAVTMLAVEGIGAGSFVLCSESNIFSDPCFDGTGDNDTLVQNLCAGIVDCPTTYDVYFGATNPPATLICDDAVFPICDPGPLDPDRTYYWQVVATNCCDSTTGPIWSFTTEAAGQSCSVCGPGAHWIHDPPCAGGVDIIPNSQALIGIDIGGDCAMDSTFRLQGPVTVQRSNPVDDSVNFPGSSPLDGHLDVIDTRITQMVLTDGAVTLTAGAGLGQGGVLPPSYGVIVEQPGDNTRADSFFDVFFEVDLGGGVYLYNHVPLRIASIIECLPPDTTYMHPVTCLELWDSPEPNTGNLVARLVTANHNAYALGACCLADGTCTDGITQLECEEDLVGAYQGDETDCGSVVCAEPCEDCGPGAHWPDQCPGGMDTISDSQALIGIDIDNDCIMDTTLRLVGPVDIQRSNPMDDSMNFPGEALVDGHMDVIDTEIVAMSLTDGAVTLTAGAGLGQGGVLGSSLGTIVETTGDPALADSFFDVIFEVDLGSGVVLYNHDPLRIESIIDCLPPDADYIHPSVCLPLFDTPRPAGQQPVANLVTADHNTFAQGACCLSDGTCQSALTQVECEINLGGVYQGDNTSCDNVQCGACPGEGDCCAPHPTPGCSDAQCCDTVCAIDSYCCNIEWDFICVDEAAQLCGICPVGACCGDGGGTAMPASDESQMSAERRAKLAELTGSRGPGSQYGCWETTPGNCDYTSGFYLGDGSACSGVDSDGDLVDDACDFCPTNCGDLDGSGFVDLNDYATFATCFALSFPALDCDATEFACSDMTGNGRVDLDDYATFAVLFFTSPTTQVPFCISGP